MPLPSAAVDVDERAFDAAGSSVAAARRFVAAALGRLARPDLVDTAVLLTSELVANAMLHAHSAATVRVGVDDESISIEVRDASSRLPAAKHYGPEAATGRGLLLVDALAAQWGAERLDAGKRVWFRLDAAAPAEAAAATATPSTSAAPLEVDLDALAASFGEPAPDLPGATTLLVGAP